MKPIPLLHRCMLSFMAFMFVWEIFPLPWPLLFILGLLNAVSWFNTMGKWRKEE